MNWGRLFFGVVIVSFGVVLLLGNTGAIDAGDVIGTWWPLVLILAGAVTFAANPGHWPVATIVVAVGGAFLLSNLDIVDVGSLIIPAVLIFVGLMVIFGRGMRSSAETGDRINSFNVFSGSELSSRSARFEGGSVSAVFGGAEIDLRQARLASDATLDVFAVFGGVEMRVPSDWHVAVKGFPLFGGIDNVSAKETLPPDAPTLSINATVLFGGLEIKH